MRHDHPIVCLVTDRRRLAAEAGGPRKALDAVVDLARDAARAGVDIIQVRERDLETNVLVSLVGEVIDATRGSKARVVVNDRLDVAISCRAAGVHLRSDSVTPTAARSIAPPGFIIGRSVHRVDEAVQAGPDADYLIAGTVFATSSKASSDGRLGVEGLEAIARAVRIPVLAIGGVTLVTVRDVASCGVAGIAGIGLFLPGAMTMTQVVARVRAAFDRPQATAL